MNADPGAARFYARQIPLAYFWFEIAALCITVGIVAATTPWIAMLLLASGDFYGVGWEKIAVASLGTLPFSIPISYLVARWVWGIAVQAYPRPKLRLPAVAPVVSVPAGARLDGEVVPW
ncbi:MAG TPA: hypothetical protein VGV89_01515 [Thermoplasmata archaeon]|nr:hypothetical protein [Thermoplasmata archaeon]